MSSATWPPTWASFSVNTWQQERGWSVQERVCPENGNRLADRRCCSICAPSTWQQERGWTVQMKAIIGSNRWATVRPIRASWRRTWTELSIRRGSHVSSLLATPTRSLHVGSRRAASPPLRSSLSPPPLRRLRGGRREIDEGEKGEGGDSVRRAVCLARIGGKGFENGGKGFENGGRGEGEGGRLRRRGGNAGWSFGGKSSRRRIGWFTPRAAAEPDDQPSASSSGYGGREAGRRKTRQVITVDDLREEIASLQEEMSETQAKASAARNRFVRLTNAVERLQASSAMAMKEGDEATARRVLKEKSNVMDAISKSHQRAKVLEALAKKLGEMISRRETQLIVALTASSRIDRGAGVRSSSSSSSTFSSSSSSSSSSRMNAGSTGAPAMAFDQLEETSSSSVFYAGEPGERATVRGESTSKSPPSPSPSPSPSPPSTSNSSPSSNLSSTTCNNPSRGSSHGGQEPSPKKSMAAEGVLGGEEDYRCRQRDIQGSGGDDGTVDKVRGTWPPRMPGLSNGEEGRGKEEEEEEEGEGEREGMEKEKEEREKRKREVREEEKEVEWESRERKMDEEELQAKFLDMERSDLERMYQRSPELDPDSGRAAADHKRRTGDDHRLSRGSTAMAGGREGGEKEIKIDTNTLKPNDLSRDPITDGGDDGDDDKSEGNRRVVQESSVCLPNERDDDQKDDGDGDGDGRLTSTSKSGAHYLAEVDLQIALVKRKLDEIRRSIDEGKDGKEQEEEEGAAGDHASRSSDEKLKAANLLLSDLLDIRARLYRLQSPGQPNRDEDLH